MLEPEFSLREILQVQGHDLGSVSMPHEQASLVLGQHDSFPPATGFFTKRGNNRELNGIFQTHVFMSSHLCSGLLWKVTRKRTTWINGKRHWGSTDTARNLGLHKGISRSNSSLWKYSCFHTGSAESKENQCMEASKIEDVSQTSAHELSTNNFCMDGAVTDLQSETEKPLKDHHIGASESGSAWQPFWFVFDCQRRLLAIYDSPQKERMSGLISFVDVLGVQVTDNLTADLPSKASIVTPLRRYTSIRGRSQREHWRWSPINAFIQAARRNFNKPARSSSVSTGDKTPPAEEEEKMSVLMLTSPRQLHYLAAPNQTLFALWKDIFTLSE
ncbi:hypothetical protein Ciccas_003077 [Cichlidogyrus casuarinus]|uniref:Uncharacterized protein n=1 Tax=Cichlidogyrus casuarinus TaxID=1844966 RepID=A0ABD2QFE1_9PLAT